MNIRPGTSDDTEAVAALWNAQAANPDSWWYLSPDKSKADLDELIAGPFTLYVAIDGDLIGFGLWQGALLTGFTASTAEAFYRLMREWARLCPGERGKSIIPARDTIEKSWIDVLPPIELLPHGFKPLAPGDDPATRKAWTYRCEAELDDLAVALDSVIGD
jgi:hypothetical protein